MIALVILLGLAAAVLVVAETLVVARDGRGPAAPPRSHQEDPQFLPPALR